MLGNLSLDIPVLIHVCVDLFRTTVISSFCILVSAKSPVDFTFSVYVKGIISTSLGLKLLVGCRLTFKLKVFPKASRGRSSRRESYISQPEEAEPTEPYPILCQVPLYSISD